MLLLASVDGFRRVLKQLLCIFIYMLVCVEAYLSVYKLISNIL